MDDEKSREAKINERFEELKKDLARPLETIKSAFKDLSLPLDLIDEKT